MKNRIAIFLILICTRTFACDCEWAGNFLEMANNSEVVALVKVKSYNNFFQFTGGLTSDEHQQLLSATFEIVELLRGDEQRTEIEVFGDPGNLCRPYINYLTAGEYYVVALNKSVTGKILERKKKSRTLDYNELTAKLEAEESR